MLILSIVHILSVLEDENQNNETEIQYVFQKYVSETFEKLKGKGKLNQLNETYISGKGIDTVWPTTKHILTKQIVFKYIFLKGLLGIKRQKKKKNLGHLKGKILDWPDIVRFNKLMEQSSHGKQMTHIFYSLKGETNIFNIQKLTFPENFTEGKTADNQETNRKTKIKGLDLPVKLKSK